MNLNDYKIYFLNSLAMFVSFTDIESILKIILLLASIIYTGLKTYEIIKKNDENNPN